MPSIDSPRGLLSDNRVFAWIALATALLLASAELGVGIFTSRGS